MGFESKPDYENQKYQIAIILLCFMSMITHLYHKMYGIANSMTPSSTHLHTRTQKSLSHRLRLMRQCAPCSCIVWLPSHRSAFSTLSSFVQHFAIYLFNFRFRWAKNVQNVELLIALSRSVVVLFLLFLLFINNCLK